jgi:hypothetical protein
MNLAKAIGKFLMGFVGTGIGLVATNPSMLTDLIPEKWATMTLAGLVVEIIDLIHNKLTSK